MAKLLNSGGFTRQLTLTDGTVHDHIIAAISSTSGSFIVLLHSFAFSMRQHVNNRGLTTQFRIADSTVHHGIVAASLGTGRIHFLFDHCLAFSVAQSSYLIILVAIATHGTGVGGVTIRSTGRRSHNRHILVRNRIDRFGQDVSTAFTSALLAALGHTGRFLGHNRLAISMAVVCWDDLTLAADFRLTNSTIHDGIVAAAVEAARFNAVLLHRRTSLMASGSDGLLLALDFTITCSTVYDRIVTAILSTGGVNLVLDLSLAFGMGQKLDHDRGTA